MFKYYMKENKITIIIDRPIKEVFEFTTNPKNTHKWVTFIDEEVTDEYPPKVGSIYKNRRGDSWNVSKVSEFEQNKYFKLENDTFSVKYTYEKINETSTKMTYIESVKEGDLENPFTKEVLEKLKNIIESK